MPLSPGGTGVSPVSSFICRTRPVSIAFTISRDTPKPSVYTEIQAQLSNAETDAPRTCTPHTFVMHIAQAVPRDRIRADHNTYPANNIGTITAANNLPAYVSTTNGMPAAHDMIAHRIDTAAMFVPKVISSGSDMISPNTTPPRVAAHAAAGPKTGGRPSSSSMNHPHSGQRTGEARKSY